MITYRDRATGAKIRQVTEGPTVNHPTYFLQSSFFPGDREMFFTSYATGAAQLCEVSLDTGAVRKLENQVGRFDVNRGNLPYGGVDLNFR